MQLQFSVFFFKKSSKKCENNAKNISFNLGFINKYLFYHPYVTMPNVSLLKFGIKYDLLPAKVLKNFNTEENNFLST